MKKFLVYVLVDPRTNAPRYVGRSSSGLRRPRRHIYESELKTCEHTHKSRWIRQLKSLGLKYEISVVYSADVEDGLSEAEVFWIEELRRRGFKLTNSTDGGEGMVGHVFSVEHRRRLAEARRGQKHSEEARRKMSEAHKGQKISKEHRRKLSDALTGRKLSGETRQKMSEAKKGRKCAPLSKEHRRKISEAKKRKKNLPAVPPM